MPFGAANLDELPGLVEEGVGGVKLFWGYALNRQTKQLVYNVADEPPENLIPPLSNGEVLEVFRTMAQTWGCWRRIARTERWLSQQRAPSRRRYKGTKTCSEGWA
jgi:hypothetical protein